MKQLKKILLFTMLMGIVGTKVYAYDIEAKNEDGVTIYYNWINDKTELEVTRRFSSDYSGNIVIPNSITYEDISYSVTSIGDNAFSSCSELSAITIPNSVKSIGFSAFSDCSKLSAITIPNSVTSIGNYAFQNCSYLSSVNINDIAAWCRISFTPYYSNPLYYAHHLFLNGEEIKDLVIPNNVTSINDYVFNGCSELTSLTIPSSVTYIGAYAFSGCMRLNTIFCVNPIPFYCAKKSTFGCGTDYLRDSYDIYNYATLHVPMGSKEAYSSAFEWRYFNNIKEDMELDGQVYYANLIVQQGTTGYTRQAVKASEKYTIYIGSIGENKVNAVTFNGIDVTDNVKQGYYTTPEIKGESILSVSYEMESTNVNSTTYSNIRVKGYHGEITIDNIDEVSDVSVYTIDGKVISNMPSASGSITLQVPSEQLYIVKVGTRTYKIAL